MTSCFLQTISRAGPVCQCEAPLSPAAGQSSLPVGGPGLVVAVQAVVNRLGRPGQERQQTGVDSSVHGQGSRVSCREHIASTIVHYCPAQVLSTLSDLYQSCLGDDLQDFLHLLLRLLDTDYSVQDWFSDQLVNKLRRDIFSPGMDSF